MSRRLIKDTLRTGLNFASRVTRHLPRRPAVRLLNYHEVLEGKDPVDNPYNQVSASRLAGHLDALLERGFGFVTVSGMMQLMKTGSASLERTLGLTFDDGLAEHATTVLPLLVERKIPATFYILSGAIGRRSVLGRKDRHLSEEEVRLLAEAGMEIGSHSDTHPVLSRISRDQLDREISGSSARLARLTGSPPMTFGYPYGSRRTFNRDVVDAVRKAGYLSAVSTVIGANHPATPPYELRRIPVYGTDSPAIVVARALGAYDWVGSLQETWLGLFPHHSTRRNGS